jgi:hypothetical protein
LELRYRANRLAPRISLAEPPCATPFEALSPHHVLPPPPRTQLALACIHRNAAALPIPSDSLGMEAYALTLREDTLATYTTYMTHPGSRDAVKDRTVSIRPAGRRQSTAPLPIPSSGVKCWPPGFGLGTRAGSACFSSRPT